MSDDWRKSKCPACGAKAVSRFCDIIDFECGNDDLESEATDTCKLNQIVALCQRYNHPGVNIGGQGLAYLVLEIIEGGEALEKRLRELL